MNHIQIPIGAYANASTVAAVAAATRSTIVGYPSAGLVPTNAVAGANNALCLQIRQQQQTVNQLIAELAKVKNLNNSLQQQLISKTNEANSLKVQYLAGFQTGVSPVNNDRLFKETIEALEAKNRAQLREIKRLTSQLQQSQPKSIMSHSETCSTKEEGDEDEHSKSNSNSNSNEEDRKPPPIETSPPASVLAATTSPPGFLDPVQEVLRQYQQLQQSMLLTRTGCPVCMTNKHTLLNCRALRSNGYLITYHSLLDSNSSDTNAATATNSSCNFHYNTPNNSTNDYTFQYSAAVAQTEGTNRNPPGTPPFASTVAATITPPQKGQENVIDLLSSGDEGSETGHKIRESIANSTAGKDDNAENESDVFAAITAAVAAAEEEQEVQEKGRSTCKETALPDAPLSTNTDEHPMLGRIVDGKGGKDRPIAIDFDEGEDGDGDNDDGDDDDDEEFHDAREELSESDSLSPIHTQPQHDQLEAHDERSKPFCRPCTKEQDDDEIQIVGETGKNPLSDFAHPRYDCVEIPFSKSPEAFCPNCYCYVCDVKASECPTWKPSGGDGDEDETAEDSHCYAHNSIPKWKNRRCKLRSKRKRPERVLKNIAIYLQDTTPSKISTSTKRQTRSGVQYGDQGGRPCESTMDGSSSQTRRRKRRTTHR